MFRSDESDAQAADLAADEAGVPAGAAASWRTAEAALFTDLLSRPDLYQSVIVLVGATVARLRRLGPSTRALLAAAANIATVVGEVRADDGLASVGIDPELVGRAALALRHGEVLVEQAAARRRDLLAAARSSSAGWVVLEETGDWSGDPFAPYRRLEAHATSGRALLVTTFPGDDFRTSRHEVDVLSVDLDTGRIEASTDREHELGRHPSAAEREVAVTALREGISRSG
jgi:hypothetical protein